MPVEPAPRELCRRRDKVWIARQRPPVELVSPIRGGACIQTDPGLVKLILSSQEKIVSFCVLGGSAGHGVGLRRRKLYSQGVGNLLRHLAFDGEDILQVTVVPLCPKVRVGAGIDQLHDYPNPCPQLSGRCLRGWWKRQAPPRSSSGVRLAFILCRRSPRDHLEIAHGGQPVRISSWIPSEKYSFAFSSLRFSNGSTAMLFSGICGGADKTVPVGATSS